jgi:hypothetical protein
MELNPTAPSFDLPWTTVDCSFADLSNKLTNCDRCHEPGIFAYDQNFGMFWRGDRQISVQFDPIPENLKLELAAFVRRKRDPSFEVRRMIKSRAIKVVQEFGDNLGEEF